MHKSLLSKINKIDKIVKYVLYKKDKKNHKIINITYFKAIKTVEKCKIKFDGNELYNKNELDVIEWILKI